MMMMMVIQRGEIENGYALVSTSPFLVARQPHASSPKYFLDSVLGTDFGAFSCADR